MPPTTLSPSAFKSVPFIAECALLELTLQSNKFHQLERAETCERPHYRAGLAIGIDVLRHAAWDLTSVIEILSGVRSVR